MRYLYLFLTLVLVSCGTDSHHFKIDGRLLNLNQGEFYVYSTDGAIEGIDTIRVEAGRFSYSPKCEKRGTLVIVFPNYSEQPVFTEPGKSVSIEGDAYKLRELKVKGTDDNKLMNQFREQCINASPVEIKRYVEYMVSDHPESIVPIYLVRRYFLQCELPDVKKASLLIKALLKAQPDNGQLKQLSKQVESVAASSKGSTLPAFSAKDLNGHSITQKDLSKGDAIIYTWASWDFESCNNQRMIKNRRKMTDMHVLGICLDASVSECKRVIERENIENSVICSGKMFDDPLIQRLGITTLPDNILLKDGKVVARSLSTQELRKRLD